MHRKEARRYNCGGVREDCDVSKKELARRIMHSRRALLYMPGDDRRKIEKATTLGVDCICMDMEDGVAIMHKAEARAVIAQAMKDLDFGRSERCIRINSVGSGFEKYDLAAAVASNPEAVVVPKIE